MARPIKTGLDYFPHDTEFDNELEYIIAVHKEIGYYVYFRLLERLYKVFGYYYPADKKSLALLANKINVNINSVNVVINDCLSEHLFDKKLHKEYEILTSRGIQKRFFDAISRRKECEIIKEYIIEDNGYINTLNVNINWINVDNKYTKERKGKEIKGKEIKLPWDDERFLQIWEFWKKYKKEQFRESYKPIGEQAALSHLSNLASGKLDLAMLIIKQSIENTWKGLFELKGKYTTMTPEYDIEEMLKHIRK